MALALSLSSDLFLMKGNLLIAVKAQPKTNKGERRQNKPKRGGGKEIKRKRREEQRGMVNVITKRNREEMQKAVTFWADKWSQQYITYKQQWCTLHWWVCYDEGFCTDSNLFHLPFSGVWIDVITRYNLVMRKHLIESDWLWHGWCVFMVD